VVLPGHNCLVEKSRCNWVNIGNGKLLRTDTRSASDNDVGEVSRGHCGRSFSILVGQGIVVESCIWRVMYRSRETFVFRNVFFFLSLYVCGA